MPSWVGEPQRIVHAIRIAVVALRIGEVGNDVVRLREPAKVGVVIPGVVIIEASAFIQDLPRIAAGNLEQIRALRVTALAEGRIEVILDLIPVFVGLNRGGGQVVRVKLTDA